MAQSHLTRVRLDTGAKVSVRIVREGMTKLDEPAVDGNGRPLADEPADSPKTSAKPAAKKAAAKRAAAKKTASAPAAAPTSGGSSADVS